MECPALASIQNGNITYGPDMIPDFDVDTVATHSCNFGFRLDGSDTRVCLFGGIWSDQPRVCQRKIHFVIHKRLWESKYHYGAEISICKVACIIYLPVPRAYIMYLCLCKLCI